MKDMLSAANGMHPTQWLKAAPHVISTSVISQLFERGKKTLKKGNKVMLPKFKTYFKMKLQ